MRKFLGLAMLLILSAAALGQEAPKAEIFGGYSYANMQLLSDRSGFNGWNASATVNINRWFGLTMDFGGAYGGSARETFRLPPTIGGTETIQINGKLHTFLFGPQFSRRHEKLTPFAHLLLGEERLDALERRHARKLPALSASR